MIISDVPLPEDSGMSLVGYLYQAGVNDGLTSLEQEAGVAVERDEMTGLYTKRAFFVQADAYLEHKKQASFCMIAVDINHFRLFNQVFGRKMGDNYILHVAKILTDCRREYGGLIGYAGADNFYYLAPDLEEVLVYLQDETEDYLRKQSLEIGYSPKFGLYRILDENMKIIDACDNAIAAMEHVKKEYSRMMAWFDPSMNGEDDEFKLLQEFEFGLLNHEFTFYLQPKVNMNNGRIIGAEALARWVRRDNRMVAPMRYIPVLEKTGFIFRLDRVIWEQVCRFQRFLMDMDIPILPISVNVSRADIFSMDVAGYLQELVEKYDLPKYSIELEITESADTGDSLDLEMEINRLKSYGFHIAMDDFGTGYSSLHSLKDLDVDVLKIDMRFLHMDFSTQERGASILELILDLADSLHVPVVAEGVEFPEQVTFLRDIGCEYAQGYYYYKPMRKEAYEDLLMDPDAIELPEKVSA
ncbi:MAG: EAL domain-containing protein [Eubacterium sp.]|nr:EAL domain-containing protein [Eubacterium sp.]